MGTANGRITFGNASLYQEFNIIPNSVDLSADGILGRDFLTKYKCLIDYEHWLLTFMWKGITIEHPIEEEKKYTFIIPARSEIIQSISAPKIKEDSIIHSQEILPGVFCGNSIFSKENPYVKFINTTEKDVRINNRNFKPTIEPLKKYTVLSIKKINKQLNSNSRLNSILEKLNIKDTPKFVQNDLKKLISDFSEIFCLENDQITTNNFYEQSIQLKDNNPSYIPNYKQIYSQTDEINGQVNKMLENQIIEHSTSPYNSPILLVPKKSEDISKRWRLVVDFRQLNKKILPDKFPLPRIDTILDQLGRAKYFSTLDLMSGFHQIPLEHNSKKYTAFSTPTGHYQFTRLPFGLNVSPNSFQRMMAIAMSGLNPETAFVYIDDIIVTGCTEKHHIENLSKVFKRLENYNLKLNPEKCKLFKTEVTYLGHKITDAGIYPDDSKYQVIKNYPIPANADEVRRFVAFCNYYRKFINNFAKIAKPLNDLLKKGTNFNWTKQCSQSFDLLREKLLSPTVLKFPDFEKDFTITTDASDSACGAILSQTFNNKDLPIAYASKTFTKGEKNKSIIEKELTAIHWAIDYFKPYVYGRKFKIRTDHRPLTYLFGMKNPSSKLTRMRLDLEEYDFELEYIKGKSNVVADALSRIKIDSDYLKQQLPKAKEEDMIRMKNKTILRVNTRAMSKAHKKEEVRKEEIINTPTVWETDRPSQVNKMLKLKTDIREESIEIAIYGHNGIKRLGSTKFNLNDEKGQNGSLILESALLEICQILKRFNRDKLAVSVHDKLFRLYSISTIKEIANNAISGIEIIIYEPPRILTQKTDIDNTMNNYHMTPTGGHIGQYRSYLKIREKFKWKNMKEDIKRFINNCEACKKHKISRHTKEKEIITSTPVKPFQVISIDTVGPLPRTNNNNRYAVTIQCDLSKFVVIIPIPNKEANTIARALVEKFILVYGNFMELKSDQGLEYNNEILKKISEILKIKQTFATAYHPETIGSLERNHRSLNEYLRIFSNEHHDDWDDWTQFYQFVYNTSCHTHTQFTPFELIFGRSPNIPQDIFKSKTKPVYNIEQYYYEMKFKLQKSNELARENLIKEKIKRQNLQNQNINPIKIGLGDQVYLKNENRKKLDPCYVGPFTVIRIMDPNCIIRNNITYKEVIVHKNRLIKK